MAAGTAALALAGPMALRPFVDGAGIAGAAGEVSVAFVLDFGPGTTPVSGCVQVPASDNGYVALAAFVQQERMAPATFASSGLLCSINAVPSSGCGQSVAGGYAYWSYFTGRTGSWTYASSGAFATVPTRDVEGWRFQNPGTGRPDDPGPRPAPQYDSLCPSGPGTPPSTVPPTAPPTTTAGGHPQTPAPAPPAGAAAAPRIPNPAATSAPATGSPTTTPCPATTTTSTAVVGGSSTATSTMSTTPCPSTSPTATAPSDPATSVPSLPAVHLAAGRPSPADPGTGTGSLIVGGLLIAALGVAAFARWRRRPGTP